MQVLTIKEVCRQLKIGQTTFYLLRKKDPSFPKPLFKQTNYMRFDAAQVEAWYQNQLKEANKVEWL